MTGTLISVVLPVHNQADHVADAIQEYQAALSRIPAPHELILVVNASTDGSLDVCRELEASSDAVRVITSDRGGWGLAVRLGLRAARGDLLCYTNLARTSGDDLTLLLLYATVQSGVVVKANRKIRDSAVRRLGSLLYNLECRALFDLSNWDINGTPKVFPRACAPLLRLEREDDLIDAEFCIVCRREGYRMFEVPIFSTRRHGGRSTTGWLSALRLYWGAIELWRAQGQGR